VTEIRLAVESRGEAGRIATLTVDNPAKLNVLDAAGIAALERTLHKLAADDALRVVILRGAGSRAFIGGADIRAMAGLDRASARSFITGLHRACQAIRRLPVPVIARIEGYALGAGLEIAASCDLRVAADSAKFGMPEVKVGIPSVIEAALLPRLVGWGRARRLLYTGEIIDAGTAERWGLVERVVAPSELEAAIEEWAAAILAAGPQAIRLQKALIGEWEELSLAEAIERGIEAFAGAYETREPAERMGAFLRRKSRAP
jgi:enoyl-CoA hydratase/carnithine racemase